MRNLHFGYFPALVLSCCLLTMLGVGRADDPLDQSKSAARVWQLAQMNKLGPFLNESDAYEIVPLDIPSQTLTDSHKLIEADLISFSLDSGPGPHVHLLQDGRYILYGDLFKTGETFALLELPVTQEIDPYWNRGRVGFAKLENGTWNVRGLWNIWTSWSDPKIKQDGTHYPVTPAIAPFELKDFNGDGVPEVIMAGEIWRYYQFYYLFQFDRKTETLQMLASAMGEPKLVDGYVRLYFNSGHRSIFEEWDFAKFEKNILKKIATWHDGEPYNPGDDEGLRTETAGPNGKRHLFRIDDLTNAYVIKSDDGKSMAKAAFTQKRALPDPTAQDDLEKSWLFQHLTKLPLEMYPEKIETVLPTDFAKYESVKVTGDPAFVFFLLKTAR